MQLHEAAAKLGEILIEREETLSVGEGSCGGLISAAFVGVAGASRFFVAGSVLYTRAAFREILGDDRYALRGLEGATADFSRAVAELVAKKFATTWAIAESGASGPTGNRYGHAAGHAALAVHGPVSRSREIDTGRADRRENMERFAIEAMELLGEALYDAGEKRG